ncbi:hypothetical protein QE382_001466 [Sphingobacterium zeae]|uniref:Uncharacterized protein n=1 Tax=Sphingobacterium zeae TaxID=1776859 RepID=A0ABU0U3E1_9SPHI|nr:hypothetical protein [Sphingobacterium zeae]MDQ1149482.1 hypothetical protein [Sphingobacterium zeae]
MKKTCRNLVSVPYHNLGKPGSQAVADAGEPKLDTRDRNLLEAQIIGLYL